MKTSSRTKEATGRSIRTDVYQAVTDAILKHLENGVAPWRRPWNPEIGRPQNLHTRRQYQGINVILLGCLQFASPYWLTIRQANLLGGHVRKGERGTRIVKYGAHESEREDEDGNKEKRTRYFLREYVVFNALQVEGIALPETSGVAVLSSQERIERAEQVAAGMPQRPIIEEGDSMRAAYNPSTDTVEMPAFERFENAEGYYQTLYHELVHSSGHPSRLNRVSLVKSDGFGGETYSKEELVAEMGAAFLGMEAGIVQDDHEQSAAYLQGWLKALKDPDHKRWIIQAARDASRAAKFITGTPDRLEADG